MTERHFYRARLVKGGPFIGVMTFFGGPLVDGEELDRSPRWQAVVRTEKNGRAILMGDQLPIEVEGVMLRNIEPVAETEYRFLVAHAEWATAAAPYHPVAAPSSAIDFNTLPVRF